MKGLNYILFIFFSFLFFQCEPSKQDFAKKGLTTKAKIAFKQEVTTESTLNYMFVMYFFTNDTLTFHDIHEHSIWKDSTLSVEQKFEKWNVIENNIGDFYSAEIIVDYDTYSNYIEGDILEIVYLPKQPHKAILKKHLVKKE